MRLLIFLCISVLCPILFAAPPAACRQATCLRVVLDQADDAYYNQGKPIMGDAAYDALRTQYRHLLSAYPELGADSKVGALVQGGTVDHSSAVLSLKKVYSDEGLSSFVTSCGTNRMFCVEPKLDGLTLVLLYREGLLVRAVTRGNGQAGSDVTSAVLASGAVPMSLKNAPDIFEVRGELYMSNSVFKELNRQRAAAGKPLLKSPRNTAAGSLRLKDFGEIAQRKLQFLVFELRAADELPSSHSAALALAEKVGLNTVKSLAVPAPEVHAAVAELNRQRAELPYGTDGVVVRVDDRAVFEKLGTTAHHPRGAVARKYKEVSVETRLLTVEWNRGEKGRWTPVAVFEPVEMRGATVERASLHSLAHLRALDLKTGDWVQVIRAGGVVPEIIGVNTARRTGAEQAIPDPPNRQ